MGRSPFLARIGQLQNRLQLNQCLLLSRRSDLLYFSSFVANVPEERSAFLLITAKEAHLLLQNFLPKPNNFPGLVSHGFTSPDRLVAYLTSLIEKTGINSLQIDQGDLRVDEFQSLKKIPNLHVDTLNRQLIWQLRSQKDRAELAKISKARQVTKRVLAEAISQLKVGQTELEVARLIDNKIRTQADCELAFPSIIAFDENSALPHHQPSHKKLHHGSVVLIDIGATYKHYCADMTRTIFWRQSDQAETNQIKRKATKFAKIDKLVKDAYKKGFDLLHASQTCSAAELDLACRDFLTSAGYGQKFIHTTGHGLGLDIHEPPSIWKNNSAPLLPGMTITIEPGVYLPGEFGVRFENTVLVKKKHF